MIGGRADGRRLAKEAMARERMEMPCHDCERPYGNENGFPDLIIPFWAWKRISPTGDDGGLLCPSCICKRLHDAGIYCEGAFMSGPIESVSRPMMQVMRELENIELALEGRQNRWGEALRSRIAEAMRRLG